MKHTETHFLNTLLSPVRATRVVLVIVEPCSSVNQPTTQTHSCAVFITVHIV